MSRRQRVSLWLHRTLDRVMTPFNVFLLRRTKGGVARTMKVDALLLTTRGRRSGRERTVVLQYFPDGEAMIITATNDGGRTHPAWYHNLKAEPTARVEVDGRPLKVQAVELPAVQAAGWWQRIIARDPSYELFERAARREFPVIRLTPVP